MGVQQKPLGFRRLIVVVGVCLGLLISVVPSVSAATQADADRAKVLAFDVNMTTFLAATGEAPFDWNSDGCSTPAIGDLAKWNRTFSSPCLRHDFGYRNFGRGGVVVIETESQRKKIDDKFLQDMNSVCAPLTFLKRAECRWVASLYYNVVRSSLGKQAFYS